MQMFRLFRAHGCLGQGSLQCMWCFWVSLRSRSALVSLGEARQSTEGHLKSSLHYISVLVLRGSRSGIFFGWCWEWPKMNPQRSPKLHFRQCHLPQVRCNSVPSWNLSFERRYFAPKRWDLDVFQKRRSPVVEDLRQRKAARCQAMKLRRSSL